MPGKREDKLLKMRQRSAPCFFSWSQVPGSVTASGLDGSRMMDNISHQNKHGSGQK